MLVNEKQVSDKEKTRSLADARLESYLGFGRIASDALECILNVLE